MKQKVKLWDIVRKRVWVDIEKIPYKKFKEKIVEKFGKESGITKYFKKDVFLDLKKSLIKKRKGNKFYYSTKPRKWTKEEIKLLRKLSKSLKGKKLVEEFNKHVEKPRSYSSITTKLSRIKRKRKKKRK